MDMQLDDVIVTRKKWSLSLDEAHVILEVLGCRMNYGKLDDLITPHREAVREAAEDVFAYTHAGVGYSSRELLFPVSKSFRESVEYEMFGRMRELGIGAVLDLWEFDYPAGEHVHVFMCPDFENQDTLFMVAPVPEPVAVGTTSRSFNQPARRPQEYNHRDTEAYIFGSDMNPTHTWEYLIPSDLSDVADAVLLDGELEFDDPRWGIGRNKPCGDFDWDMWRDDVLRNGVEATYLLERRL